MLVFDATAIASLFDAYRPTWTAWRRADNAQVKVGFPAAAIVEAAATVGARKSAWDVFLMPPGVEVLPLDQAAAVEIGEWTGTLAARQSLWEARNMECPLLTRDASLYAPGVVPLIVV